MYERKFNADDVRPTGDDGHTVYTVTSPVECRFGTFKEGSKVLLQVNSILSRGNDEIGFDVISAEEKDAFTLKVSPDSIKWLNEHFEKDEELSHKHLIAVQKELDADAAEAKIEDRGVQFASLSISGSLCVAMLAAIFGLLLNISAPTLLKIFIILGVVICSGLAALFWYRFIRENKYHIADYAYREERDRILQDGGRE